MTKEQELELARYITHARVRLFMFGLVFLCVAAFLGILAMAGTIYLPTKTEPQVLAAFIAITSSIIGSLTTILMNAVQAQRQLTPKDIETSIKIAEGETEPLLPEPKILSGKQ